MSYDHNEAARLILQAAHELTENKLIIRTWGNISARLDEEHFLITPSGMGYERMSADDLVVVDMDGHHADDKKPSSEFGVHLESYRLRNDVNFVIHTHQTYASALSTLGTDIKLGERVSERTRALIGPRIVCAEYGQNGSKKINRAVAAAIEANPNTNHVLMRNHGALCLGTDYDNAFKIAYILEKLCAKIYEYYVTDGAPLIEQLKQRKDFKEANALQAQEEALPVPESIRVVQSVPENLDSSSEPYGAWILHVMTPFVMKMSALDQTMKAYLDDLAQIAGPQILCVSPKIGRNGLIKAMGKGNAIFVEGKGAYCTGSSYDEALCVAEVLEKGCIAAYVAMMRGVAPISIYDAMIDRYKYVRKYSNLK